MPHPLQVHGSQPTFRQQSVNDLVKRAKLDPNKSGILRREALQQLLTLAHTRSPEELKILAAGNIQYFIADFPDTEEQAINAIYDLCEDPSPQVRIEGYKAISDISRVDNKLLKRNADVLLQLLQSDEPEEVTVVKKALIEHIEMGPAVTLGVLCDQLSPVGDEVDDEEKNIRARLRMLVVNFLLEDGQESIQKYVTLGSPPEAVLLESLSVVIPQLDPETCQRFIKDLILKLPVFRSPTTRGEPFLNAILERASLEVRKAGKPSLSTSQPYLQLAQNLVIGQRAASPLSLLQYYCRSLTGRIFLQQLPRPSRIWIVNSLADLLLFCHQNYAGDREILQHQWTIVDACPFLLETLLQTITDKQSSNSCIVLLRNCLYRKKSQQWTISPALFNTLSKLQGSVDKLPPQENRRELQKLLMFLMPPAKAQGSFNNEQQPPISAPPQAADTIQVTGRPVARTSSVPFSATAGPSKELRPIPTRPTALKRKSTRDINESAPKRSLLNRLQSNPPESVNSLALPIQGLSIKGAASMTATGNSADAPRKDQAKTGSHSLLARLQGVDSSVASSDPSNRPASEFKQRGKRRKK